MKCAIIISEGIKQIMLTPETDADRLALKMIESNDISVEFKTGTFFGSGEVPQSSRGYLVTKCEGGYLRAYSQEQSLMLVLKSPKPQVAFDKDSK